MPFEVAVGLVGTAILSAIASGVTKATGSILEDAYKELKGAIRRRYGADSDLYRAIREVERNPEDARRITRLKAEIKRSKAEKDSRIRNAAEHVYEEVESRPEGLEILQIVEGGGMIVYGDYQVTAGGNVHIDNSRVFYPPPPSTADTMNLPGSVVGWVIGLPAIACMLVGFLLFVLELTADNPNWDQLNLAFRLAMIGIIVAFAAKIVDGILSRNRHR